MAGIGGTWTPAIAWRRVLLALVLVGSLYDFAVVTSGTLADNRFFGDLKKLRSFPALTSEWHTWLNENADDVRRVLLVGDAQPFDLTADTLYNTVFDDSIFEQMVRGRTSEQVRATLAERGVSHILVAWGEIERYRSPGNYGITDYLQPEVFDRLVADGVLEEYPPIKDNSDRLYRVIVNPDEKPAKP